ncbi:acetyl-CoA carboxylase biotin carboxyl carrier protein subunit [Meridianimaribacter sp. CL38]|uniref:acetyl-CoA carboxylase biotin carboxyl carrier protein subunit n=1 Tax=Meridianimaribacter sp. CL38 TaxID=2213021 RepID=UPI00103D7658|nr:acetyl-CoA carboxylase biotin carboxyl carrier protein subunit [Meridianimaribacter sp. CL38]TBV25907.1 acetyl-CoA carboxylase biotin carboxyl carrier protein subunit [Meridianimaribacter sp. CL38]
MTNFKTSVNNTDHFEISNENIQNLDVVPTKANTFHILKNNQSFNAEIIEKDFNNKTYAVKVNNTVYNVAIADYLDQLIKDMGFEVGASKHVNDIKAPMPGLILDISISQGQEVKENDTLLILEAMKMENVLTSPRDGVIKTISVAKGDAVDKNQLLIEFE